MTIFNRNSGRAAAAIIIALSIFGCSNSKSPTSANNNPPPPAHSSRYHTVSIAGFAFGPATMNAAVGDTVVWTNNDSAPHTVTSDTGNLLQSANLSQGQTFQHIFAGAGTFAYHCAIHLSMHGSITVQ